MFFNRLFSFFEAAFFSVSRSVSFRLPSGFPLFPVVGLLERQQTEIVNR
jgi:hypothetical protein